jgi:parvulin-like peptidyl-prolyl isomerase
MAKQKPAPRPTKKHRAKAERERIQRNWILGGTIVTSLVVLAIVVYGVVYTQVLLPNEPIALVDGEEILTQDFQLRIKLASASGADPLSIGTIIVDTMIEEFLVRREAAKMGIEISESEIDKAIQESYGYYAEGTPTSVPTSTPDPTLIAELELTPTVTLDPTPTPTEGPSPTPASSATPQPTPTPYTFEAFETNLTSQLATFEEQFGMSEQVYREFFEIELITQRIMETFEEDIPEEAEQTFLRHIVVEEQEQADELLERLNEGEAWDDLAAEASIDDFTNQFGGDLGWFTEQSAIERFDLVILPVLTEPIGDIEGPIQTFEGWHLFEIVEREIRPLSDSLFRQAVQNAFDTWLQDIRDEADIVIVDDWNKRLPSS